MHPILFELGGVPIPSYGFALMLAFASGILLAQRRAQRRGLDGERILEVGIVALVTSLLGSRLLWAVTHLEVFQPPRGSWTDVLNPLQSTGPIGVSGLSMMGGVALAVVCSLGVLRLRGAGVLRYADITAPSIALGGGITRIGCFLNGCCFGTSCELPWAVGFPAGSPAADVLGEGLVHPAQLYASLGSFALFAGLLWLARRTPRDGVVLCAFLVLSGTGRILLDGVRHYQGDEILVQLASIGVTVNQAISAGLVAAGLLGLVWIARGGRLRGDGVQPT